jgi:hypothetical protein
VAQALCRQVTNLMTGGTLAIFLAQRFHGSDDGLNTAGGVGPAGG